MTETVPIDRPPAARATVSRPRSKAATVSASALALHLDCSRTYIAKLEAEGVIQRQGDGFSRWITSSASSFPMSVRLQSRCCASADALTVAGFLDRGRGTGLATDEPSLLTVSVIVFVPVASR